MDSWHFFAKSLSRTQVQSAFGQEKEYRPIIVIDPGHGGRDSGAIGITGIEEKDVVLKITKEVLRLNREMYRDSLEIYSTHYTDTLISLGDRTKLAKALKADVFISLHCNRAVQREARGIEVFIEYGNVQSPPLAGLFIAGLNKKLGLKDRGVRYGNFQVLRETGYCASVLLELGFLSNLEEAEHLVKDSSITAYALLIFETVTKFLFYD